MKAIKFLTFMILLSITSLSFGQGAYGALRFSQQYYEGTARSLAMGNAFTALGGDLGAIPINPAASGVYRHSEFILTPSLNFSVDHSTYLNNNSTENRTRFGLSNIGWVGHFSTGRKTGLLNINVAFTANQTNNFNSRTSAYGTEALSSWAGSMAANMPDMPAYALDMTKEDEYGPFYNTNASWSSILGWNTSLLDTIKGMPSNYIAATENIDQNGNFYLGGPLEQEYFREVTGYTSDVSINVGGNVSNKLFFGLNLTLQSINYHSFESFTETSVDSKNFDTGFKSLTHSTSISTTGVSVGLKAGLIYLPVAGLRIGAAISTPTWMHLTDKWEEKMSTSLKDGETSILSPLGMYDYRVTSPFKWNIGAAYTFGKIGLISFDYENTNYSQIIMADSNGNKMEFSSENSAINQTFKSVNNFRAGLEAWLTPNVSLRGGYNLYDTPEKGFDGAKQFASIGVGFKSNNGFFMDIAYQQQINYIKEKYTLYDTYKDYNSSNTNIGIPVMDNKYLNWKLLLSFGFRF